MITMNSASKNLLSYRQTICPQICVILMRASSSKKQTHYETLEIKPSATQNEIKTAYYKLTMQYHPDKNKSDDAKHKFQAISDAYEILGNYDTRKQYDKTMVVHRRMPRVSYNRPVHKPFERTIHPANIKIFDFDKWTRMHYQEAFREQQERISELKSSTPATPSEEDVFLGKILIICCNVIITITTVMLFVRIFVIDKKKRGF